LRRKDRSTLLKERPIRSFLRERPTLILEKPLIGSRGASSVKEEEDEKRVGLLRLQSPKRIAEGPKPKEQSHLSYGGQSGLDYCIECAVKHSQTAKVLMREAIQRAQAGSPSDKGVQEKVRGVVEELVGMEDDTGSRAIKGGDSYQMYVANEKISTLNSSARILRKYIYAKGGEVGTATLGDLREIKDMIDQLVDATYAVRMGEECIGCTVETLCGGNLECVEFVERAAKSVKDPIEFRKILKEVREKYKRG